MLEEFHTVLCIFLEEECDANSFMLPGLSCLQKQRLGEESGGGVGALHLLNMLLKGGPP